MPEWFNRGYGGLPLVVLKDVEDNWSDEDDVDDDPAPVTFGERHERREDQEDIEYQQQM